jgi:DNA replication protein DnaC
VIAGNPGVGKSAIAAMIGIEALRQRFSVFMVTHTRLQELRFDDKPVVDADGQSPVSRVSSSDLLILDDFNESFMTDKVFGPAKLETLIAERNRWLRTTIMTTRILPASFKKEPALKSLFGVMQETMVGLVLGGDDYRAKKNQEMRDRLGIGK